MGVEYTARRHCLRCGRRARRGRVVPHMKQACARPLQAGHRCQGGMEAAGGARKEKPAKVCRREVLVPGEHMPDQGCPPGKHHGTVTRVVQVEGRAMAVIKMTDFQKGKLHIQVGVPQWDKRRAGRGGRGRLVLAPL